MQLSALLHQFGSLHSPARLPARGPPLSFHVPKPLSRREKQALKANLEAEQTVLVREKVMTTLGSAFREVFKDCSTQLVPIMDHRSVHLKLVEWDKLQMKLESVEVWPAPSAPTSAPHSLAGTALKSRLSTAVEHADNRCIVSILGVHPYRGP